jgi:DNA topoisomerase-3
VKNEKDPQLRQDRIWDAQQAQVISQKCQGQPASVTEQSKKNTQNSPQLYDLTLLQREANARFGFSAKNTLALAQSLYERHKVLTYPRTDSKYLPEDYLAVVEKTMRVQKKWQLSQFAELALSQKYIKPNKRIFNNAKVSDHHAIIPTSIIPGKLSDAEAKIYLMVVQRFLAVFFPPAVFLNTKRYSIVQEETFLSEGRIMLEAGWKAIYGANETNDKEEKTLPPVPAKTKVICSSVDQEQHETTPPPRYNEATLLSAMENSDKLVEDEELAEAMKERGLGTPATRAAIIEKLINEKYVVREGKELTPTGKAFELLALLEAMNIELLASPEMTGEWEYKLNRILKGDFTRKQFMKEIRDITRHIITQVKNFDIDKVTPEAAFSPVNGMRFFMTPTAYVAEDKSIAIRKILGGRHLGEQEVLSLLKGETIGPFSNFRSKKGKKFTASVRLTDNKVEFLFADSNDHLDVEAVKQSLPLGVSPIDSSPVYETSTSFISGSALDGDEKNGLKISKVILDKEITAKHITQLLDDGRTELISGFISKKKKPFDAYLVLNSDGKIRFEFPPRKGVRKE